MVPSLNATVSALEAYGRKLAINAENIANADTDGYEKIRAVSREGANGTVEITPQRMRAPGAAAGRDASDREGSNVALEEEIPELMVSVYGFKANLKTLQAQDEIIGTLLDTVA